MRADPSDSPCCCGQQVAEGPTSTRRRLAPWLRHPSSSSGTVSPWGCRWACHASASSLLASHLDLLPLSRNRPGTPLLPAPLHRCHERECVAAEEDHRVAKPPRCWGCRATTPLTDTVARLQGCWASPHPPSYQCRRTTALSASERLRRKYTEEISLIGLRRPAVRRCIVV